MLAVLLWIHQFGKHMAKKSESAPSCGYSCRQKQRQQQRKLESNHLLVFNDDADAAYIMDMMIVIARMAMIVIIRRLRMEIIKWNVICLLCLFFDDSI